MKLLYNSSEVYSEKTYLKQYNDSYFRIIYCRSIRTKGFESSGSKPKVAPEEVERISLSRTRRNIRELAFCNPFTYFVTFTVSSDVCDRFSLEDCQSKLKKMLKAYKRKNKDFIYLFITEKHKDGAYHFHGLCSNIYDLYINDNGYLSSKHWDKLGFNSFSKIKDFNKTCNYITKYITKDCIRNSSGQIYISSRGLKKCDVYEIPRVDLDWQFVNDFVKIKDSYNFTQDECKKFFQLSIDIN